MKNNLVYQALTQGLPSDQANDYFMAVAVYLMAGSK